MVSRALRLQNDKLIISNSISVSGLSPFMEDSINNKLNGHHPLELSNYVICDTSSYLIDGEIKIPTSHDGNIIWKNNEFAYEAPF